ncbi:MAG: hydantoinase/oxoprolinase family protein [Methylobacteriaceae bacterium]|nr:hydantoinase/oxoprolinase family protein [Methylobacteriaceae bacterium]
MAESGSNGSASRHGQRLRIACDVGGTFTDLVVSGQNGFQLFKSESTPADPLIGIVAALELAARAHGASVASFLAHVETVAHATTRGTNALLTGGAAKTAFLTTEGHRDILLLREGGRLNPYDNTQSFPPPYVPRALTFEVPERMGASGEIVRRLDEEELDGIIDRLAEREVEAVAVCLLWSVVNPAHEIRVGERLAAKLKGIPFTLSHRLNPIVREYRRASAAAIDASLKPLMSGYLANLDAHLRALGFAGRLFVVTSQGGFIEASAAAEAPIHMVNSGPSVAPVAGRHVARLDTSGADAIVADTGGTSYDLSLVRNGRLPWTSETWLGGRFTGHMTGFPSVDVRSIGAGGGSIAWVDEGGLLHVGPKSAGAEPGPACYGRGGASSTVTDCALALGYLDPDSFLGGRMRLNAAAARRCIEMEIARPLRLSIEDAALAVIDVLTQNMVSAIEEITVQQGIDPAAAVLVAGGGAAGFNSVHIARRLGCPATLFPQTGAALSAAGALLSDLVFVAGRVQYARSDVPDISTIQAALAALSAQIAKFTANAGPQAVEIDYWVEARYPQQTWEIEVPLAGCDLRSSADLARIVGDFHDMHQKLYAVCDRASPIEMIAWRARASCGAPEVAPRGLAAQRSRAAGGQRRVYFGSNGWAMVPLHPFPSIAPGTTIEGPAIVESSVTTIVVPPGSRVIGLGSGTLKVEPVGAASS